MELRVEFSISIKRTIGILIGCQNHSINKELSSTNSIGAIAYPICKRRKLKPYLIKYTNINSKCINNLNNKD